MAQLLGDDRVRWGGSIGKSVVVSQPGIAKGPPARDNPRVDAPKRHLVVDGHNILHAWKWMDPGAAGRGERSAARERLIEALRIVGDAASMDVSIVFDGRGDSSNTDPGVAAAGFAVIYAAAGLTADGVIERLVAADARPQRCIVATADALVRGNVLAAGGESISPAELQAQMERAQERARRAIQTRRTAQQKNFGNKLPL